MQRKTPPKVHIRKSYTRKNPNTSLSMQADNKEWQRGQRITSRRGHQGDVSRTMSRNSYTPMVMDSVSRKPVDSTKWKRGQTLKKPPRSKTPPPHHRRKISQTPHMLPKVVSLPDEKKGEEDKVQGNRPGTLLEKRIAPDGKRYTKEEFVEFFGGTNEWDNATPVPPSLKIKRGQQHKKNNTGKSRNTHKPEKSKKCKKLHDKCHNGVKACCLAYDIDNGGDGQLCHFIPEMVNTKEKRKQMRTENNEYHKLETQMDLTQGKGYKNANELNSQQLDALTDVINMRDEWMNKYLKPECYDCDGDCNDHQTRFNIARRLRRRATTAQGSRKNNKATKKRNRIRKRTEKKEIKKHRGKKKTRRRENGKNH